MVVNTSSRILKFYSAQGANEEQRMKLVKQALTYMSQLKGKQQHFGQAGDMKEESD